MASDPTLRRLLHLVMLSEDVMATIRPAIEGDIGAIIASDHIAVESEVRRSLIRRAVTSGTCFVADSSGVVVGYGILNYNFYGCGWVDMLYTHPEHRRHGIGSQLLRHMEGSCVTPQIFQLDQSLEPANAVAAQQGRIRPQRRCRQSRRGRSRDRLLQAGFVGCVKRTDPAG